MNKHTRYRDLLEAKGIQLTSLGLGEIGLTREDAFTALEIFKEEGTPILGGDVYYLENNHISLAYANWYVKSVKEEAPEFYAKRSWIESRDYIKNIPDSEDKKILFVFTIPDV